MDSWRTDWHDRLGVEFGTPDHGVSHHAIEAEGFLPDPLPPAIGQAERRMQLRAHALWASLRGEQTLPPIAALDIGAASEFSSHAVLLDFSSGIENPALAHLGDALAGECGDPASIHRLSDAPENSLLARIAENYVRILALQSPVGFEAEFASRAGHTMLYRGMLLPFADEVGAISHVLGVINWKELADADTCASVLREIRQAFDLARAPVTAASPPSLETPARATLFDWLATARSLARMARPDGEGGRSMLYAAIGAAWDFARAARTEPREYARLLAEAGLKAQRRAPMVALAKLVFGPAHDKTRLTEYALVLAHAHRLDIARGALASWLASTPGGMKGVVITERRLRAAQTTPETTGAMLLARRLPGGAVEILGEVGNDPALLARLNAALPPMPS